MSDEIFLNGFWCYKWYDECLKVAKILPGEKTIIFAAPHAYGIGGPSGGDFYALNLLEELDAPEEYYLNRKTGVLYFWPPKGDSVSIGAKDSRRAALSVLRSSMMTLSNVSNVTVEGMT